MDSFWDHETLSIPEKPFKNGSNTFFMNAQAHHHLGHGLHSKHTGINLLFNQINKSISSFPFSETT